MSAIMTGIETLAEQYNVSFEEMADVIVDTHEELMGHVDAEEEDAELGGPTVHVEGPFNSPSPLEFGGNLKKPEGEGWTWSSKDIQWVRVRRPQPPTNFDMRGNNRDGGESRR